MLSKTFLTDLKAFFFDFVYFKTFLDNMNYTEVLII